MFGDGKIGDTNNDGKTDYRVPGARYVHGGPEFLSIIEGNTGKEVHGQTISSWAPVKTGETTIINVPAVIELLWHTVHGRTPTLSFIGRGLVTYRKSWWRDHNNHTLTRQWRSTTQKGNEAYGGQGYHSLSVGDVDEDSYDDKSLQFDDCG